MLEKLSFLIGKWNTHGTVYATADAPEIKINGTDSYEWTLDKAFIRHTVDVTVGDRRIQSLEMIGYDADLQKYMLRSFDNRGNFTVMYGGFGNRAFNIYGNDMRATLHVNSEAELAARWETGIDAHNPVPWMELKLHKVNHQVLP